MAAAARRKPAPLPIAANEGIEVAPTPERMQRDRIVVRDIPKEGRQYRIEAPRWIDRYRDRNLLSPDDPQENAIFHDAAERYLRLATAALKAPNQSTLANLVPNHRDPAPAGSEPAKVDAAFRLARVNRAIGPAHAECLMAVVYFDQSVAEWVQSVYRDRGWRAPDRRVGMDRLRDALWHAARYWRLL